MYYNQWIVKFKRGYYYTNKTLQMLTSLLPSGTERGKFISEVPE